MRPFAPRELEARFVLALRALGVANGEIVLVAVSGGADSVALLRLFCAIRAELGLTVFAAHLNHGMRGSASKEDARFVCGLCASLGVPCTLGDSDAPALAARLKTGPEDAARQARYAFLEEARGHVSAKHVALAHHMEDQAETVLLHLARGCGLSGLTGMRGLRGVFVRPLLGEHRETLRSYLTAIGQEWREDETNEDYAYARNLMRGRALPALAALNPNLTETLAGMAERLTVDEQCLCAGAMDIPCRPRRMPYGLCLRAGPLREAHEALRRRALMSVWAELTDNGRVAERLQAYQVEALSTLLGLRSGRSCNLPGGWRGLIGREHLHLLSPACPSDPHEEKPTPLRLEGETRWRGGTLRARPANTGERGNGRRSQVLDGDMLEGAVVRFRRTGDRFRPLGAAGSQPLGQTLIDRGIDRPFRALTPMVASGSRALWLIGMLPAHDAAVTSRTARPIHFSFEGELPWE